MGQIQSTVDRSPPFFPSISYRKKVPPIVLKFHSVPPKAAAEANTSSIKPIVKPETFHSFPKLPLELRNIIWRLSAPHLLLLEVACTFSECRLSKTEGCSQMCNDNRRTVARYTPKNKQAFAPLAACTEARVEIRKLLPNLLPSADPSITICFDSSTAIYISNFADIYEWQTSVWDWTDADIRGTLTRKLITTDRLCEKFYKGASIKRLVVSGPCVYRGSEYDWRIPFNPLGWRFNLKFFFKEIKEIIIFLDDQVGDDEDFSEGHPDWPYLCDIPLLKTMCGDFLALAMDGLRRKKRFRNGRQPVVSLYEGNVKSLEEDLDHRADKFERAVYRDEEERLDLLQWERDNIGGTWGLSA